MRNYSLGKVSVLVAERSASLRAMMRGVFRELGIRHFTVVADPTEAFEAFVVGAHDLVFMDWAPGFDGIGLVLRMRRDEQSPNPYVPIIVMSANTESHYVYKALDAGMTEFLAKPISAATVYRRICAVVESTRPFVRIGRFFGPDRRRRVSPTAADRRRTGMPPEAASAPAA